LAFPNQTRLFDHEEGLLEDLLQKAFPLGFYADDHS
jgi:hypothetical protein